MWIVKKRGKKTKLVGQTIYICWFGLKMAQKKLYGLIF